MSQSSGLVTLPGMDTIPTDNYQTEMIQSAAVIIAALTSDIDGQTGVPDPLDPRVATPRLMTTLKIQHAIHRERERQEETWGSQSHSRAFWLAILVEEIGEVAEELITNEFEPSFANLQLAMMLQDLAQLGLLAKNILEAHS